MESSAPKFLPDAEWLARFRASRKRQHLFAPWRSLEVLHNADPAELATWPHVFLDLTSFDALPPRGKRLTAAKEQRAQLEEGHARACSWWHRHPDRSRDDAGHRKEHMAACAKRARIRQGRIRWLVRGVLALRHRRAKPTATAWALLALDYAIAVSKERGGKSGKGKSRNRRAWIGVMDAGPGTLTKVARSAIPSCRERGCGRTLNHGGDHRDRLAVGDPVAFGTAHGRVERLENGSIEIRTWPIETDRSKGKPYIDPTGRRLAFWPWQAGPRRCRCGTKRYAMTHAHHRAGRCARLFHGRKSARLCPDCRRK